MLLCRQGSGLKHSGSHPQPVCLAVGRPVRSRASQQQQHSATAKGRSAGSFRAHRVVARFKNGGDAQTAEKQAEAAGTADGPSSDATLVPVTFELCKHCPFGQAVAILGDAPSLGEWDVTRALRLEWSEGDVWRGCAELPLDTPVAFKYIQVNDAGGLVCWGSDIAGGSNLSLLVSPSVELVGELALLLEPPEAADTTNTPYLLAHLDSDTAVLPESAAPAAAAAAAAAAENGQLAEDHGSSSWESPDPAEAEALRAADAFVAADEQQAADEEQQQQQEEEAEDDQPLAGLADEPSAEYATDSDDEPAAAAQDAQLLQQQEEDQEEQPAELQAAEEEPEDAGAVIDSLGQLQLQDDEPATGSEASQGEQEEEGGSMGTAAPGQAEEVPAAAAVVEARGPGEVTAESVQEQGLASDTQGLGGTGHAGAAGAGAAGAGGRPQLLDPVAAGGVAAGYEDAASVGASVAAGLMEAGDGETAAGPVPTTDTLTPPPSWTSNSSDNGSSSSISSHMITSIDLEGGSEADDDSSSPTPATSTTTSSSSVVDSTPVELDKGQLMAATAQESARLASSTAADAAAALAAAPAADSSRGALEGLPASTLAAPDSSSTTAAADTAAAADVKLEGAVASKVVPGADNCPPPPANSKLVAASPSIASVDTDAPLAGGSDRKAITEIEGSSSGVEPVDKYEDSFGALTALAAAAAASYDGGHDHEHEGTTDREDAAAAAEERRVQLVRAEEGGEQEAAAGVGRNGVDGERTGTWTGEAAAAAAAATDNGSAGEGTQRATEEAPAAADNVQQQPKRKNWLQRLFGGGDDSKDDRA